MHEAAPRLLYLIKGCMNSSVKCNYEFWFKYGGAWWRKKWKCGWNKMEIGLIWNAVIGPGVGSVSLVGRHKMSPTRRTRSNNPRTVFKIIHRLIFPLCNQITCFGRFYDSVVDGYHTVGLGFHIKCLPNWGISCGVLESPIILSGQHTNTQDPWLVTLLHKYKHENTNTHKSPIILSSQHTRGSMISHRLWTLESRFW